MHWTYDFDEVHNLLTVRTWGHFSLDRLRSMAEEIIALPTWRPGTHALFDHRELAFTGTDFEQMTQARRIHQSYDQEIGNGKTALLMAFPLGYGLGRMYSSLMEGNAQVTVEVFHDPEAARQWVTS